jgi:cell division septal protein FtsQ
MRRRFTLVALPILMIAGATYALGYSTLFTVSSVEIIGSRLNINPGVIKGEKLARIQPKVIATKFENLTWVKKAEVSRDWISGKVTVRILERTPVALYNGKAFDVEGKSFQLQNGKTSDLIQIQAIDATSALKAVDLLNSLDSQLSQTLKSIKVQNSGSLELQLAQGDRILEVKWGINSENELKTRVYQRILALPENKKITKIDLSAPHAPIVN